MPADRCPTCDREGCPAEDHWKQYRAAEDAGNYDLAVESLALFDECGCELVDWRARAIAAESQIASVADELADDLATAQAEIDHAVAGLAVASMLPSMSRLRHGATPTVRAWLGRLVEKLRGAPVPRATATIKEPS